MIALIKVKSKDRVKKGGWRRENCTYHSISKKRKTHKNNFLSWLVRQKCLQKYVQKIRETKGGMCICTEKKNYELKAPCAKSFSILRLFPFADVNLASGWRILAKSTGGHRQPSIDVRIVGFVFCKCKCKKILLAILKIRDSFALRIIEPFQGKKEKNFEDNFHLKKKRCLT